jgi:hypothetical protein
MVVEQYLAGTSKHGRFGKTKDSQAFGLVRKVKTTIFAFRVLRNAGCLSQKPC